MKRRATAFYTPETVAGRLVADLSLRRPAIVIDPACGDGQLLGAVVRQRGAKGLTLVGVDTNGRALLACKRRLKSLGANSNSVRLYRGDFLALAERMARVGSGARYVVMNPPFISYKRLSHRERRHLKTIAPGLGGRFNLADAFVLTAVAKLAPRAMISILPASTGARLSTNGHLQGRKVWRGLPDSTFAATISTGALLWRSTAIKTFGDTPSQAASVRQRTGLPSTEAQVLVRNGVATGADAVFLKIAAGGLNGTGGRLVRCARGRDVARGRRLKDLLKMWMPTSAEADASAVLTRDDLKRLRARHCVQEGGRRLFDYHSAVPRWVLGKRKLIVPEICRKLAMLDDREGRVLPLHSTLAIVSPSGRTNSLVKKLLRKPETWKRLRRTSEVMVGGAIRLTSASLTAVIVEGLAKNGRGRKT